VGYRNKDLAIQGLPLILSGIPMVGYRNRNTPIIQLQLIDKTSRENFMPLYPQGVSPFSLNASALS
ncbi:MAG: hypothetical protein WBP13_03605, partial [Methylophilaceae bacterium]